MCQKSLTGVKSQADRGVVKLTIKFAKCYLVVVNLMITFGMGKLTGTAHHLIERVVPKLLVA